MNNSIFSFTFEGTVNRMQYLGAFLLQMVASFAAFTAIVVGSDPTVDLALLIAVGGIGLLVNMVWSWAINVRRMRETGANPWWVLASMVPYVGIVVLVILLFVPQGTFGGIAKASENKSKFELTGDPAYKYM